jgi:hypothetical protein
VKNRSKKLLPISGALLGSFALFSVGGVALASSNNITKLGSVVAQIEALNCAENSFQVLGLKLRAADQFVLTSLCESPWDDSLRYAAITITEDQTGAFLATNVSSLGALYVPGVSTVYISGIVTESKSEVGMFSVLGSTSIFYDGSAPTSNDRIEVVGTQPQVGGPIIAASVHAATSGAEASQDSIIGTGAQTDSIIGTGITRNSIIGTGSSTSSIIGTGVHADSIIGTGVAADSIIGTGVSRSSIIGTGVQADSIIGTGAQVDSIIGTGVATNSIIGTGVSKSSIIGTGVQADSIIGTGVATNSIIGTGVSRSSIIGTGIQADSIIGTGVATSSIIGTGIQADSIIGTGAAAY